VEIGIAASDLGVLLAVTLLGDAVVSPALTTRADRLGRRPTLDLGAG